MFIHIYRLYISVCLSINLSNMTFYLSVNSIYQLWIYLPINYLYQLTTTLSINSVYLSIICLEKFSFHSNPKEGQCQRMFNYCIIALISHAS